jgi:hypothetical protein
MKESSSTCSCSIILYYFYIFWADWY